ncbi:TetR family transcriptional regulator [Pararhodobacter aggregans]|nr:TetR family transcriptional regulator [Pararhodobacter aggregans]PTX03365.1 TetR family transcriptional regulator [Pararhodobacter aggregans]
MSEAAATAKKSARAKRKNDPEAVRQDLLQVAIQEFAEHGLAGARVDRIAANSRASKMMLYYYFDNKEGLYIAALEQSYIQIREAERDLDVDSLPPLAALRSFIRFTFERHQKNPEYVRLVVNENLAFGEHIRKSEKLRNLNAFAMEKVRSIFARGVADGTLRPGIDPTHFFMTVGALSFYQVSNKYTFASVFEVDMDTKAALDERLHQITELLVHGVSRRPED